MAQQEKENTSAETTGSEELEQETTYVYVYISPVIRDEDSEDTPSS